MFELPPGLHGAHLRDDLASTLALNELRQLVADGRLVAVNRAVLVDRRTMLTLPTRAAAGLLAAGPAAALTGHTAALIHGCTAADAGTIHILAPYARKMRNPPGFRIHNGHFDEDDVLVLDRLRALTLTRVVADMLCDDNRGMALACADQALAQLDPRFRADFKATVAERIMERLDSRGRRRSAFLLDLATGIPESPAESRMLLKLVDCGLPIPVAQHPITDVHGTVRYRLDFAWLEPKVALEYDGYEAHAGRAGKDELRDLDLRRRGWLVIRADVDDLRDPFRLVADIRAAFRSRRFVA
ncbi:endonuclease domain-containing protein [Labedaea rhizosphaerae]|uniref:Uncharacterized protein DUF559 n=1 Tax=Labedaea rhizosphaerae TaxID=598644 RepID=A0A4R6SK68_LABRH|nr:DUF559 domain-containing protein [Labedaea rhizosphaerae]TDQ04251.1 uncharacterized protein DUF559 [Labedaea rhizosphaerae]